MRGDESQVVKGSVIEV